jgi:F-type H+-transporting ATPase subunit b
MDRLVSLNPGLLFWTVFNFLIFLFLLLKFGLKPMMKSLKSREDSITNSLSSADEANKKAQAILVEVQAKLTETSKEVNSMIAKGRDQANEIISQAKVEAGKIRQEKMEAALKEIKSAQDAAFTSLKNEIADMVIIATEKVLQTKINPEVDNELIVKSIEQISNN